LIDAPAESSQIRVRSAAVGDGYFPEPDEQRLGRGIFIPDDLLARHSSGFTIVGRISDVINVAGKKVSPAEVEAQLLQFGASARRLSLEENPHCATKKWPLAWSRMQMSVNPSC